MSAGETVWIKPGTRLDDDQNPIPATGSEFDIEGCEIEPLGSDESEDVGRSGTVTRIRIFAPGPVSRAITATDVVEARGETWRIDGEPDVWIDDDPELSGPVITASRRLG